METIENFCPHSIAVMDGAGGQRVFVPSGPPARIETEPGAAIGFADGIPVHASPAWKGIVNLPPLRAGIVVVVSQIVALAVAALLPERYDIVYPGTGPHDGAVRNPGRGVVAVSRLIRAV